MPPKEIVLCVEGEGDVDAVPILAKRVLKEMDASGEVVIASLIFRVRGVGALVRGSGNEWLRHLENAKRQKHLAGVLLVLDGDLEHVPKTWDEYVRRFARTDFCAFRAAASFAQMAKSAGAGKLFSVAAVFVMKEFEAWLMGGIESLRGRALAEGRGIVSADAAIPPGLVIEAKRDIKGVLKKAIGGVYSQTLDQADLARHVDLKLLRQRCSSFRRFERAIGELVASARGAAHTVSPVTV